MGAKIAPMLPVWFGNALCDLIGLLIYAFASAKRKAVLCNLRHVLPDQSEAYCQGVARGMFRNSMRNYYDLFRGHALTTEQRLAQIEVRDMDLAYEAFKRGKGIIAIAAHQGSFSFVTQIATKTNFDFFLTVEPIQPPELFDLVRNLRSSDPRNHTIAVGGGEVRTIFRALKDNHMVCLAIDRDISGNGEMLEFFGAKTKLPTGAAEIALRTGAMVMPIQIYRVQNGKKHILHLHPGFVAEPTGDKAADVARVSRQMLQEIEKIILRSPEDWVVLQPLWPDCE